jgi:hypothetical protein
MGDDRPYGPSALLSLSILTLEQAHDDRDDDRGGDGHRGSAGGGRRRTGGAGRRGTCLDRGWPGCGGSGPGCGRCRLWADDPGRARQGHPAERGGDPRRAALPGHVARRRDRATAADRGRAGSPGRAPERHRPRGIGGQRRGRGDPGGHAERRRAPGRTRDGLGRRGRPRPDGRHGAGRDRHGAR